MNTSTLKTIQSKFYIELLRNNNLILMEGIYKKTGNSEEK